MGLSRELQDIIAWIVDILKKKSYNKLKDIAIYPRLIRKIGITKNTSDCDS